MTLELADKLYTSTQVADILGVSLRTLYRYMEDGKIGSMRTGSGRHRFTKDHIIEFLNAGQSSVQNSQLKTNISSSMPNRHVQNNETDRTLRTDISSTNNSQDNNSQIGINSRSQVDSMSSSVISSQTRASTDLDFSSDFDLSSQSGFSTSIPDNINVSNDPTLTSSSTTRDFPIDSKDQSSQVYDPFDSNFDLDLSDNISSNIEMNSQSTEVSFKNSIQESEGEPVDKVKDSNESEVVDYTSENVYKDMSSTQDQTRNQSNVSTNQQGHPLASNDMGGDSFPQDKSGVAPVDFSALNIRFYKSDISDLIELAKKIKEVGATKDLEYAFTLHAGLSLHFSIKPFTQLHIYANPEDMQIWKDELRLIPADNKEDANIGILINTDIVFVPVKEIGGFKLVDDKVLLKDLSLIKENELVKKFREHLMNG